MSERKSRAAETAPAEPAGRAGWFVLRRLHGLSGVLPLGLFLVLHLWINAFSVGGRDSFDGAVAALSSIPGLWALELFGVLLPLGFHAVLGLLLTLEGRSTLGRYPSSGNWLYALQRASGVLTLVYLSFHLWQFRLPLWLGQLTQQDLYDELRGSLSSTVSGVPLIALGYLLGLGAAVFHLASGLHRFCFTWGITASARASRTASLALGVLGMLLFVLGANTIVFLATGTRVLGWAAGDVE